MDFYESLLNPAQLQQGQASYPMQQPMQDFPIQGQMGYPMHNQMLYSNIQSGIGYNIQGQQGIFNNPQGQMGYPMQGQMGYTPKINKATVIQELQNYIIMTTRKPISKIVKLEEVENSFRHACVEVGDVSYLDVNYFPVPLLGINLAFYFCLACCTLYIQKDFM